MAASLGLAVALPAQAADDVLTPADALVKKAEQLQAACKTDPKPERCSTYCPEGTGRLCALTDKMLANAAVVVDPEGIRSLFELAPGPAPTKAGPTTRGGIGALPSVVGVSSDFAAVALQGLAKFVADRAKQESVGWFLDQLGESLCNQQNRELNDYWLPATCALASEQRLSQYGAGAEMLEGLRQAIEADARGWPGVAAGASLGAVFMEDAQRWGFDCSTDKALCEALTGVRRDTAARVSAMLDGRNAVVELSQLASSLNTKNHTSDADVKKSLYSPATQLAACGLGLPHAIAEFRGALVDASLSEAQTAQASLLAALVFVPACHTLTLCPAGAPCDEALKVNDEHFGSTQRDSLARVEALAQLARPVRASGDVAAQFRVLKLSLDELKAAIEATRQGQDVATSLKLPQLSLQGADSPQAAAAAINAYLEQAGRALQQSAYVRVATAAIGVADSTLAVGSGGINVLRVNAETRKLLPGLCERAPSLCANPEKLTIALSHTDQQIDRLRAGLSTLRQVVSGQWGTAFSMVLHDMRQSRSVTSVDAYQRLARRAALLIAFLQAKDGDAAARVLDSAADPPGGWRIKARPGNFTFSLSAQPGVWGAAELRHGPYGAFRETGKQVYGQAPALAMPVGLDFAWGMCACERSFGIFVPLIDPVAFLQYDVGENGRLPGASVKTALSPGLGLRFNLPHTPFSLTPMVVYRPSFRAWKSDADAVGADAFQLGLLASVDVTLFSVTREDTK